MSNSQIPRNNYYSSRPATPSPKFHPSFSAERSSPGFDGYTHKETHSLREPSPLFDDGASESMVTAPPASARSVTDPGPRGRFRDRSKTPLGLSSQNRRSAILNPSIHQDLAGIDLPKQDAVDEPELLTNLNKIEDCCHFIRDIRRYAFDEGLSNDKKWMADYAATRLEGEALIWHAIELDDATRSNWDKLQQAILERARRPNISSPTSFRRRLASNQSTSTTSSAHHARSRSDSQNSAFLQGSDATFYESPMSDASYSSIPSAMWSTSPRAGSTSSHSSKLVNTAPLPQHGKLLLRDYTGVNYVGVSVNFAGHFRRTSEHHEALLVKVDRNQGKLNLQNSSSQGRTLGITWDIDKDCTPHLGKGSKDRAYLVYLDHNGKTSAQSWTGIGPSKDTIWTVYADNSVHPIWIDGNGVKHELQVLVKTGAFGMWHVDTISLVTDAEAFMKDHSDYIRSYLVFEPQA